MADESTPKRWLIKSLRADEFSFFRQLFLHGITRSTEHHPFIQLRDKRKKFTVYAEGVFKRPDVPEKYRPTAEQLKTHSPNQSMSLVTPGIIHTPVFGHTRNEHEAAKLVGVTLDIKDAMLGRLFIYDAGTTSRPYDFDRRIDAEEYYKRKVTSSEPGLFSDLDQFETALKKKEKSGNGQLYNEVLARIRWNVDGSSKVSIFSNTLEARLLAQDYARLIRGFLKAQYREEGKKWNANYTVPICFYLPDENQIFTEYTPAQQHADREEAARIFNDEPKRKLKFSENNYEFLLGLDSSSEACQLIDEGEPLFIAMMKKGNYHLVESLIEHDDQLRHKKIPWKDSYQLLFNQAINKGCLQIANWLLHAGARLDGLGHIEPVNVVDFSVIIEPEHILNAKCFRNALALFGTSETEEAELIQAKSKRKKSLFKKLYNPDHIKNCEDLKDVLMHLEAEERPIVYQSKKTEVAATIQSGVDLGYGLQYLSYDDRIEFLSLARKHAPTLIQSDENFQTALHNFSQHKNIEGFQAALTKLTADERIAVCIANQDELARLILETKDIDSDIYAKILSILFDKLPPSQQRALCEEIKTIFPLTVSSHYHFLNVMKSAPPEVRGILYDEMKDKLPSIVIGLFGLPSPGSIENILKALNLEGINESQRDSFFQSIKHLLPSYLRYASSVNTVFSYLNGEQRNEAYELIKESLPDMIVKDVAPSSALGSALTYLTIPQSIELLERKPLKSSLSSVFQSRRSCGIFFIHLSAPQYAAISPLLSDTLLGLINTSGDFKEVFSAGNSIEIRFAICASLYGKLPSTIQNNDHVLHEIILKCIDPSSDWFKSIIDEFIKTAPDTPSFYQPYTKSTLREEPDTALRAVADFVNKNPNGPIAEKLKTLLTEKGLEFGHKLDGPR